MRSSPFYRVSGFTLVEMLAVLAVVAILAAISFGLIAGVQSRQARSQAAAELAALSTALESYRSVFGDYPRLMNNPDGLFLALYGRRTPDGTAVDRRAFIDRDSFTINNNRFEDPWGRTYLYFYDESWKETPGGRFGFLLFSRGPSGQFLPPDNTGFLDRDAEENLDNIYAD